MSRPERRITDGGSAPGAAPLLALHLNVRVSVVEAEPAAQAAKNVHVLASLLFETRSSPWWAQAAMGLFHNEARLRAYRLLTDVEAADIVARIKAEQWEAGKASSSKATGTTKRNLELRDNNPVAKELLGEIADKLKAHSLHAEHFVSRIVPPKFNWYRDAGEYRTHTDAALMYGIRTDLACTVFLTEDYEGGELCIGGVEVKGKAGMCVVYECGKPHYVKPVTSGDRISAITWMQSYVPEAHQRDILNRAHRVTMKFAELQDQAMFAEAGSVHESLLKLWMRN